MNRINTFLFLLVTVAIVSCGNDNKTAASSTSSANETSNNAKITAAEKSQGESIVGEWEMAGSVLDTNDNLQIDEAERKNLKPASFKDYMKLNSDGSGVFTTANMEGRYEVEDRDGKKFLRWFDKGNSPHRVGTIIKVSKEELHIKEPGGSGLFVWKRI